jgi:peptidoglycan hydrolase-like protein with peptidoglycan-binding domain
VRFNVVAVQRPWGFCLTALAALLCAGALHAPVAAADAAGGVSASAAHEVVLKRGARGPAVRRLQRVLGVGVDGVFGRLTQRAVKRLQRRRGLAPDGVVGPLTRRALGLPRFSAASVRYPRRARPVRVPRVLRRIASCESGGNPRALSPGGRYRGKYQFSRATWRALGGRGDPARASERLQDRMALKLYRLRGTGPWPSCSRH